MTAQCVCLFVVVVVVVVVMLTDLNNEVLTRGRSNGMVVMVTATLSGMLGGSLGRAGGREYDL